MILEAGTIRLPLLFLFELVQFVGKNVVLILPRVLVGSDVVPDHVDVAVDRVLLLVKLLERFIHTVLVVRVVFILSLHLALQLLVLLPQLRVALVDVVYLIVGQVHVLRDLGLKIALKLIFHAFMELVNQN